MASYVGFPRPSQPHRPEAKAGGELVSISEMAKEIGMSRRNVVRRVDEARAAKAAAGETGKQI